MRIYYELGSRVVALNRPIWTTCDVTFVHRDSPHDMAAGNSLSEMISFPYLKFSYRSIVFVETWLCGGLSFNAVSIEKLLPLEWIQRNKCRFLTFDRNIHMVSSNVFRQSIDWILCDSTFHQVETYHGDSVRVATCEALLQGLQGVLCSQIVFTSLISVEISDW